MLSQWDPQLLSPAPDVTVRPAVILLSPLPLSPSPLLPPQKRKAVLSQPLMVVRVVPRPPRAPPAAFLAAPPPSRAHVVVAPASSSMFVLQAPSFLRLQTVAEGGLPRRRIGSCWMQEVPLLAGVLAPLAVPLPGTAPLEKELLLMLSLPMPPPPLLLLLLLLLSVRVPVRAPSSGKNRTMQTPACPSVPCQPLPAMTIFPRLPL